MKASCVFGHSGLSLFPLPTLHLKGTPLTKAKRTTRIRWNPASILPHGSFTKAWTGIEKGGNGLARWISTDHFGAKDAVDIACLLGFTEGLKFLACYLLIGILSALATGFIVALLIAYVLPYLLIKALGG